MNTDLDTLLTALYVTTDDYLKAFEDRPRPGQPKALTDAELVTLAVAQALLGFHSQTRWLRYAHVHLRAMFSYLPNQSGYNKRLRAALPLVKTMIRVLARESDFWFDNHPIVDSTPVPCGASRPTAHRSDLAGWAHYGYCASHTRYFWGLRLYLVCTPTGMPILWALANPKIGEREVLEAMLTAEADVVDARDHLVLIADKGFAGSQLDRLLTEHRIALLRPTRKGEKARWGQPLLKKIRQLIESVNDTLKGQLDLEQHAGRTDDGVSVRVAQRLLALTAAIWHNDRTGQPSKRSLIAYDH